MGILSRFQSRPFSIHPFDRPCCDKKPLGPPRRRQSSCINGRGNFIIALRLALTMAGKYNAIHPLIQYSPHFQRSPSVKTVFVAIPCFPNLKDYVRFGTVPSQEMT